MVCIEIHIHNGNGMVCIRNGILWQWYALEMEMVCIVLPFPCMVCIGNGMVLYTLAMEMVCIVLPLYGMHWKWYGMVCISIGIGNDIGMIWYGMD
jgi:hypothetical protein